MAAAQSLIHHNASKLALNFAGLFVQPVTRRSGYLTESTSGRASRLSPQPLLSLAAGLLIPSALADALPHDINHAAVAVSADSRFDRLRDFLQGMFYKSHDYNKLQDKKLSGHSIRDEINTISTPHENRSSNRSVRL